MNLTTDEYWRTVGNLCMVCGKEHARRNRATCSVECGKKYSSHKWRWAKLGKRNTRDIGFNNMLDREFPESDVTNFEH